MSENVVNYKNVVFRITQTTKEVTVSAEVPRRRTVRDPKIRCGTEDITAVLEKEGVMCVRILEAPSSALTNSKNELLSGRWIFEKPKPKPKRRNIRESAKAVANKRAKKLSEQRENKLLGTENME